MSGFNNYGDKNYGSGYQGADIRLSVKDQYGIEVFFITKRNNKLKKLLDAYCDRQFIDLNSTSFLFDGRSIRGEQTPHELQMEEADKIHAILHRSEEHRVQYDQLLAIKNDLEEELIRLRKKSVENAVDALKSKEEMNRPDMFTNASIDAIGYQSRSLAKYKVPTKDDATFFYRADYHNKFSTSVSGKEVVSAPPIGHIEVVGDGDTASLTGKRKKVVPYEACPSKRTRIANSRDGLEKGGGSLHHSDGHYDAESSLKARPFGDDKEKAGPFCDDKVTSGVICHDDTRSDPLVCRKLVRGFLPLAEKLGVARVGVKDAIAKNYQHIARMGSLLPDVRDKVWSIIGQSKGFQKKPSILHGRVNVEENDLCSLKEELRVLKLQHEKDVRALEEMRDTHVGVLSKMCDDLDVLGEELDRIKKELEDVRVVSAENANILEGKLSVVTEDRNWLITKGFSHVLGYLRHSKEYVTPLVAMQNCSHRVGLHEGIKVGYEACLQHFPLESLKGYDLNVTKEFDSRVQAYEDATFPYLSALATCVNGTIADLKEVEPKGLDKEKALLWINGARSGQTSQTSATVSKATKVPEFSAKDVVGVSVSYVVKKPFGKLLDDQFYDRLGKHVERSSGESGKKPLDKAAEKKVEVVGKVVKKPVRMIEKPLHHIEEKLVDKDVMEKPLEGGSTSLEKVVSADKSLEKASEKVSQGGDTCVSLLSDVSVGGCGTVEGATGSSLGGNERRGSHESD